ncbi:MAG: HAMP domain-containing sensor histidine kinase [Myxococcota bacterium]
MAFAVAHDLRQPLMAALLALDGLQTVPQPRLAEGHGLIRASIVEALDRIRALLDLAGLERRELVPTDLDLRALALGAIERLSAVHADAPVSWQVRGTATVEADPTMVSLVLGNLLENAIVHGCADPARPITVKVVIEPAGEGALVSVEDDGVGVDAELEGRLFTAFTKSARHEGTGLGLSTSLRAARRCGGDLRYSRVEPHGSRFGLLLP